MTSLSRRDFLKLGGLSLGSLAFSPSLGDFTNFEDNDLVRVATEFRQCIQPRNRQELHYLDLVSG